MSNFWRKADEFVLATVLIGPTTIIIGIIVIVGLVKACVGSEIDPMDNSINTNREIVDHVRVLDSLGNGFRVVYATTNAVTQERLEEIRSREHIQAAFKRMKHDALINWKGSLFDADICDFALFARKYNVDDDIYIHNIFVCGIDKMNLYIQPNPNLPDCATWMNHGNQQGNQYLTDTDINYSIPAGEKIYRYWKCDILRQRSDTDERFSHFTEKERIW